MKMNVNIAELMDELDLDTLGVTLDPAPVDAGQIMDDLAKRGVLTAPKKRRRLHLTVRTAVAAALVLALSVTAYAVGGHAGFFARIFGDADPDAAEAALGDDVTEVDRSVTAADFTLTAEDCLIDENGVGAISYTVERPEGLPAIKADPWSPGQYKVDDKSGGMYVTLETKSGLIPLCFYILNDAETADTVLHGICYFHPMAMESGGLAADDTLLFSLIAWGADRAPQRPQDPIQISAEKRAPSVGLTCGELTAALSPLSITISPPPVSEAELNAMSEEERASYFANAVWHGGGLSEMTVHYEDGGEYVLAYLDDEGLKQNMVSCVINDRTGEYTITFDRFVDADRVNSITATDLDGAEYVFTPAA